MMTIRLVTLLLLALIFTACNQNLNSSDNSSSDLWSLGPQNYIQQGFTPQMGDQVWVRVFDEKGAELVFEKLDIRSDNLGSWQEDLAHSLNKGASGQYLQVRLDPNEVMTSPSNYIWLKHAGHSYVMGLSH